MLLPDNERGTNGVAKIFNTRKSFHSSHKHPRCVENPNNLLIRSADELQSIREGDGGERIAVNLRPS
jgi:hypothetical protein